MHTVLMRMDGDKLVFTSWVLVEPASDLPGVWVSHCLDFDVISQGASPAEAVVAVTEAVGMAVTDDLNARLDPFERRAPSEFWDRLLRVLKHGKAVKISEVRTPSVLATQLTVAFERISHDHQLDMGMTLNIPSSTAHVDQLCAA